MSASGSGNGAAVGGVGGGGGDTVGAGRRTVVFVCHGPSCGERGGPELCQQLRELLNESSARRAVRVCETTCMDNCATGPNALIGHEGQIHTGLRAEDLLHLVALLAGPATVN